MSVFVPRSSSGMSKAAAKPSSASASGASVFDDWAVIIGGAVAVGVGIGITLYAYSADKKNDASEKKLRVVLTEVETSFDKSKNDIVKHITTSTWNKIDDETLKTIYDRFADLLENKKRGFMSRAAFDKLMRGLGVEDDMVLASLYRVWDRNADGHIDFVEFVRNLNDLIHGSTRDRLHRYFRVFDLDANGSITREEIVKLFRTFVKGADEKTLQTSVSQMMVVLDANGDHRITYPEFERACTDPLLSRGASVSQVLHAGFERPLLAAFGVTAEHIKK